MTLTISQRITMATMTRAMQLARGLVKEELKRQRVRIADVEAREITARRQGLFNRASGVGR